MRIGELAKRSGLTVRTIRYYVEERLLPAPSIRGKYGEFDDSYLQRLQLIQTLKQERLSISAIRRRLAEMGLLPAEAGPGTGALLPDDESPPEGLFRSRFAQEAGLTAEQVSQLERLGLLESGDGLLPPAALPLARTAARLLVWGASMEDIAEIADQVRREVSIHRQLLERAGRTAPLDRALRWQEQAGAIAAIRDLLLQRWGTAGREES